MENWLGLVGIVIGAFAGSLSGVWGISLWLNAKFLDIRTLIYSESKLTRDELTRKMEYHEKHDDARFDQISNELWAIKLRNAARDGLNVQPVYRRAKYSKRQPLNDQQEGQ